MKYLLCASSLLEAADTAVNKQTQIPGLKGLVVKTDSK